MKDWAVILGSSSGFGAATCREIASKGINIYGIPHLLSPYYLVPVRVSSGFFSVLQSQKVIFDNRGSGGIIGVQIFYNKKI